MDLRFLYSENRFDTGLFCLGKLLQNRCLKQENHRKALKSLTMMAKW